MCMSMKLKVKAVNVNAPKLYRVSCGKCEECRAVYKESWNFRLMAELEALMSNGWQAGFITLTYSNWFLPIISPRKLIDRDSGRPLADVWKYVKDEPRFGGKVPQIPCFDRLEVSDFFIRARQWLYRKYGLSKEFRLRYIACCEYGSHTKRPHMHCLLIFPKCVNAREFFDYLAGDWDFYGFTIPSRDKFDGFVDKKGREHKGFLIDSYAKAARYAAKYTTKDIYYDESIRKQLDDLRLDFVSDRKYFRNSLAFHCQSKSLGSSILQRFTTDAEKLDAIKNGVFFVGEDKPRVLPVYLKNRILYDNKYVYEMVSPETARLCPSIAKYELGSVAFGEDFPARRLVQREASEFFKRNAKEIYELKVVKYSEFFAQFVDSGCMATRRLALFGRFAGAKLSDWDFMGKPYDALRGFMNAHSLSVADVARLYLVYYGVEDEKRVFVPQSFYHLLYLNRYQERPIDFSFFDQSNVKQYNEFLAVLFDLLDDCFKWWFYVPKVRSREERLADEVSDMVKSEVA